MIDGTLLQCADLDGVSIGVDMGSNVHVKNYAELQVIAPLITFTPGFKIDTGGKLAVFFRGLA